MTGIYPRVLRDLAERINEGFRAVDSSRVRVGLLLIEARAQFESEHNEGDTWTRWCADNIRRSYSDIKKCMALARADNSVAAAEAERARNREAQQKARDAHGSDIRATAPLMRREHNDNVYTTNPELPKRLIAHFRPTGLTLDPCRGGGAFYDHFPEGAERAWCEIAEGRDFLEWVRRVDWIITNPPWSAEAYRAIARHAYRVADNVVFLARWHTATATYARHRDWLNAGHGWRETVYIPWKDAGFRDKHGAEKSEGFILAAFHWQRGWTGGMRETYWTQDIAEIHPQAQGSLTPTIAEAAT
jgi:hypothetical protein